MLNLHLQACHESQIISNLKRTRKYKVQLANHEYLMNFNDISWYFHDPQKHFLNLSHVSPGRCVDRSLGNIFSHVMLSSLASFICQTSIPNSCVFQFTQIKWNCIGVAKTRNPNATFFDTNHGSFHSKKPLCAQLMAHKC